MEEKINFKTIWRAASLCGIILAAVCSVYMLVSRPISGIGGVLGGATLFVVDAAKIFLCIFLMVRFMKKFKEENEGATVYDLKRFGTWIAVLSALIFSAVNMMYYSMHPEIIEESMSAIYKMNGAQMDTNTMNALENMMDALPQAIFIAQFIYCFLWGWILSAIIAPRISDNDTIQEEE